MSNGAPSSLAKVEVNVAKEPESKSQESVANTYPQLIPRFIPKEGYELIGTLVKVDPTLAKYMLKLLKGTELVPDEHSPTGYSEKPIPGAEPFCNPDGVDKIIDMILVHINTPLSYKEGKFGQPPSQIAGNIAKQFIKDLAANYDRWKIKNPSLIPQLAAILFNYIKAAQGQQSELPDGLFGGGALQPRASEQSNITKSLKGRVLP